MKKSPKPMDDLHAVKLVERRDGNVPVSVGNNDRSTLSWVWGFGMTLLAIGATLLGIFLCLSAIFGWWPISAF